MTIMQKGIRKILTISLIILMILPAILANYTSAVDEAQKPNYSIGDYWKYSVRYFDAKLNGTTTKRIVGESNMTMDGKLYNCFVIETSHIMQGWTFTFNIYIEKENYTIVKEDSQVSLNGAIIQIINATYSPPFNELDFPMTMGKNWTTEGMRNVTTTLPPRLPETKILPFSQNFSVGRTTERVNVPAGEFDTFVIEYLYLDGRYEEYYSPEVSGNVRESQYNRRGEEITRMELLESNYIPQSGLEWWVWLAIAAIVITSVSIAAVYIWRTKIVPQWKRSCEEDSLS